MADQHGRVCCHLHFAKPPYMREGLSEVLRSILWRMVTKNASKDHEPELLSLSRLQGVLCSHVHEADVAQITSNLTLKQFAELH